MIIENKIPNQNSLERFISAQNTCYEQVVFELGQGKKTSHWIWYVFPQLAGLGFSEYSVYYGIKGLSEAKAYWAHSVLRKRYEECLHLVLDAGKAGGLVKLGGFVLITRNQAKTPLFVQF